MKNSLIVFGAFALLFAAGCSKEQITPNQNDSNLNSVEDNGGKFLTFDPTNIKPGEQPNFKSVGYNTLSAHYTLSWGATVTVAAIQNSSGLQGHASLTGPVNIQMDVVCLNVFGNRAVWGGKITHVNSSTPHSNIYLQVGNTIYFAVEDNGQGSNATGPDRFSMHYYFSFPEQGNYCGWLTPNNYPTYLEGGIVTLN